MNILSQKFCVELAAIDIQTGRCDIYGEGSRFSERVYLCFTGVHFDAVVFGSGRKKRVSPHDKWRCSATALASTQRRDGQFTDKKTMTLICKTCGHVMTGDYEARLHAGSSGHKDFVMKKAH